MNAARARVAAVAQRGMLEGGVAVRAQCVEAGKQTGMLYRLTAHRQKTVYLQRVYHPISQSDDDAVLMNMRAIPAVVRISVKPVYSE